MRYTAGKLWDSNVLHYQSVITAVLITFSFLMRCAVFTKPEYRPEDLKLNINTATKEQLIGVPYIGKKTAEKIIKMRKEKGRFNDLKELKNLRYYKKFKYYLKVE